MPKPEIFTGSPAHRLTGRQPIADRLDRRVHELRRIPVRLVFDGYPKDMVSRAQVFAKLIAAEAFGAALAQEMAKLEARRKPKLIEPPDPNLLLTRLGPQNRLGAKLRNQ